MNPAKIAAILISIPSFSYADQIRNRYNHEMLLMEQDGPKLGVPGPEIENSQWTTTFDDTPDSEGTICFTQSPDQCLGLLDGELRVLQESSESAKWKRVKVPDMEYYFIRNTESPEVHLNQDHGKLTASSAKPGDWSAMWAFDETPIRDARSVHLNYEEVENASEFYIEAKVVESHPSSYFAAIVFSGGYIGIQQLTGNSCSSMDRQIIFSLWNEDGSPEKNPPASALATVTKKGPGVEQRPFSGEGSGAQTYKCFKWEDNKTYKFDIRSHVEGRHSVYRAYFQAPGKDWEFIAEAKRPANGKLLEGVYSFVEDFGRNGGRDGVEASDRTPFQRRAADFMNPWFKNEEGEWEPARQAKFTAWSENQPLTNITAATPPPEAGKSGVVFRLETGGHVVQQTQLNSTIEAKAMSSSPPSVPK